MMDFNNKSEKQQVFSEIRGVITQLNDGENFCSVTLQVGHDNTRNVNLICKKPQFDLIAQANSLGDKVFVRYFLSSRFKNERWYTMANILAVHKVPA